MQCYTELLPPTAVTHAVSLSFLGPKSTNLVVAKTSLLQVFELRAVSAEHAHQKTGHASKLVLVGEYSLSGTVTSLASIRPLNTKAGGEALLVSFRDAKISLIEWDPENHRIATLSIHYYEGDNIHTAPFGLHPADCESYLTVDPRSRCAALKFAVKHLAILPFRQAGDELAEPELDSSTAAARAAAPKADSTPYAASFVLPLTALDPALSHLVHLAFLYEYREPTFGIVSASKAASSALLDERKDLLTYTVITLDLEQRASTTLLSVTGLPFDIFRVIPLPLPIGGALLVGANELVHVDQSGKTNAVGVNEFARQASDFSMADQSSLALRLEDCVIESLDSAAGDMLIVLDTGDLAVLTFRVDGRTVSGLSVHSVAAGQGGHVLPASCSSSAALGRGNVFLGSEDGASTLLGWSKTSNQLSRKRNHAQMLAEDAESGLDEDAEEDEEDDDDADDDLYGGDSSAVKRTASTRSTSPSNPGDYIFRAFDTLPSLGPISSLCFGKPISQPTNNNETLPSLSILAVTGRNDATSLAELNREVTPTVLHKRQVPTAQNVWSVYAKQSAPKSLLKPEDGGQVLEAQMAPDQQFDQYLVVHSLEEDAAESSKVFKIDNTVIDEDDTPRVTEIDSTEFEGDGETANMGTLAGGTRIVQVKKSEIRSYDSDLGLSQIFPVLDETTDEELQVIHSSFCDPYLLIIRNDNSAQILEADKSGDLDELERGDAFLSAIWISGCIYKSAHTAGKALAFLLTAEGGLQIFQLPNLQSAGYIAPALSALPPVLTTDNRQRRATARETLAELIFADLGNGTNHSPYLVLRSSIDDLTLYEPFHYPRRVSTTSEPFTTNLRFRKVPGLHIPKYDDDASVQTPVPLRALLNVNGYATVFMGGPSPCFVFKEASSLPRIINLKGKGVKSLHAFNTRRCEDGFIYIDALGTLRECRLPSDTNFGSTGWAMRNFSPLAAGHEIHYITYHPERKLYVLTSSEMVDFHPAGDDTRQHGHDEEISLRPKTRQYHLHLYHAESGKVIDTFSLPSHELVTSVVSAPLEVSEVTRKQKLLLAAGTISQRGDNYAARGGIYVLEVIDVVPEPGHAETGVKLHLLSREETKGGITALIGIHGLLGTAQGQKIMFRGLKEDGQCLPVAFLDAQTYVSSLKSMGSSNLWLAADAWKGLWFGGFSEEPYRISLFGKSRPKMEVIAADFLPFEGQLYLIVIDADLDMHALQYDPENPKSLSGQRLLHRSTFHLGHHPTTTTLLPSTLSPFTAQPVPDPDHASNGATTPAPTAPTSSPAPALHHLLLTTHSGSLALLTPLDETTYRRLSALQAHLASVLEHPAGLNPRAYRAGDAEAVSVEGMGGRGTVDGDLVCRIGELGAGRRAEVLGRAGAEVWGLRSDLEIISGRGLAYF